MSGDAVLARSATLVFAGALVVLLAFEINGFDLINDVIGAGLVLAGLWGLQTAGLAARWSSLAVASGAVFLVVTVLTEVGAMPWPLLWLGGLTGLATAILGGLTFRDACDRQGLFRVVSSWSTSLRLVVWIWGGLAVLGLFLWGAAGGAFHYEGPAAIPVVILVFVPAVHMLISLWRTRSNARWAAEPHPGPVG